MKILTLKRVYSDASGTFGVLIEEGKPRLPFAGYAGRVYQKISHLSFPSRRG